ncbi:uncharacterized protein LOC114323475 isoform X2 [Camellia sinensis]|uniref:uncharacterized protein LOC114323475 isoform X2 n=1 Tax=Camellia sinensis TaxID=4442 RepID=UPI001035DAA9|nr:uncharacterized protein LOC114323475 isoform X2 [Camellia sinensis]
MLIFGRRNSFMKWIIFDYLPANDDSFASLNYSLLILGRRSFKKWVNFDLSPIRYLVCISVPFVSRFKETAKSYHDSISLMFSQFKIANIFYLCRSLGASLRCLCAFLWEAKTSDRFQLQ